MDLSLLLHMEKVRRRGIRCTMAPFWCVGCPLHDEFQVCERRSRPKEASAGAQLYVHARCFSLVANDQQPTNIHSSATNSMSGLFGDEDDEDIAEQNEEAEEEDDEEEEDDILDMGDDTGTENQDNHESLLMRFCPHDSSMLYPHENKESKTLEFACKLCQYTEPSRGQLLVYRNEKKKEVTNLLHTVPSAISDDPTLARSNKAHCTNCGHNEAVFFQSDVAQSDSLALIFVCCNCDHKWVG